LPIKNLKTICEQKYTGLVIVMKIDGTSISPIGSVQASTKISQINKNHRLTEQDKLAVSENAQVFRKLVERTKELPDIREDKVQTIANLIDSGEFSLDSDSIAASLLDRGKTDG
jgi:negative regulator of flagellin synthesis FlgM